MCDPPVRRARSEECPADKPTHIPVSYTHLQLGNPTNAEDLAHHILQLAVSHDYGVYHCTGEGVCSWYEFASEIIRLSGVDATVAPCTSAEYCLLYTSGVTQENDAGKGPLLRDCSVKAP